MTAFLLLKYLHILSAVSLFGAGIGTAFHLFHAHRTRQPERVVNAADSAVAADLVFTLPAAVIQPVTGITLAMVAGYPLTELWLILSYVLYVVAIGCWLGAFSIQRRIRDRAENGEAETIAVESREDMRRWIALGWIGLGCFLVIFALMTFRPTW